MRGTTQSPPLDSPERRRRGIRAIAIVIAAAAAAILLALRADAAGLLIADGGLGGRLEIEEHVVKVTINNGVAVTDVTQVFRNLEDRQVEALYTFPVPRAASVSNFSMWIGGREMVGEVVEKKRAREIYDSYKARRIDPGLLEQTDYRTFEMRIFPIAPRAEQRVQITYYQELDHDHDEVTWVYPLATNTRELADSRTQGVFSLDVDVRSEVPIASMASPSHDKDFVVAAHDPSYHRASLETRAGDLNRDVVLSYKLERPRTGLDIVASKEKGEDGYFCLLFTAGKDLESLDTGMDYVFVLDISGSMAHGDKLVSSRRSVDAFVDGLGEKDRFELITFNVQVGALFNALADASDDAKAKARTHLAAQQGRGGTLLQPAIEAAYRYGDPDRRLNVVILSDGMTEQAARAPLVQLIRTRPANARVFCVGVGNDVNRPLLEQLASEAGGLAAFVSPGDDFERQARAFRRKLTRPAVAGVRIAFDGGDVYDIEPQRLPDLYHGSPIRVYGRYRSGGTVAVKVTGSVLGRDLEQKAEIELPEVEAANSEIERMWASKRVDRLLKEADAGGSRDGVIAQVVDLGETYSIVSEYTSFLVLENDAEYQRWRIERRNLRRTERDRTGREALARRLDEIRERAQAGLGPDAVAREKAVEVAANAPPAAATPGTPGTPNAARRAPAAPPAGSPPAQRRRGFDFNIGGGGGGGPVGPLFVALAAWLARRKRASAMA